MTDLVLQSPDSVLPIVEQCLALTRAQSRQDVSAQCVRLHDVLDTPATRQKVATLADAHRVDWAFVPSGQRLSDYRAIVMDMDSTLINIECIDEIAGMAGLKEQVSAITEAAMRGEIKDFSESLIRRVALLKGLEVNALDRVLQERLQLNPGAEKLIQTAHQHGLKTLLVSGGFTFFTGRMQQRLGLTAAHANELEVVDGKLTGKVLGDILDGEAKARHLLAFVEEIGATPQQAIAIGDGANDLKMMALAGISVAYHAKPIVREATTYSINVGGLDTILGWFNP
ncbi:MAG: phosphoserine phosphatase SerB [Pigmentiphaga sp.]|nr:phosphoserine phosphatase SerB [Pigmentiphaga sp.]